MPGLNEQCCCFTWISKLCCFPSIHCGQHKLTIFVAHCVCCSVVESCCCVLRAASDESVGRALRTCQLFTYMRLQRSYCIVRHSRSRRRRPSTTIRYEINAVIDYSTYLLLRSYCAVRTRSPTVCTPTVPCPGALAERPLVFSPQRQQQSKQHDTNKGSPLSFIHPYLSL